MCTTIALRESELISLGERAWASALLLDMPIVSATGVLTTLRRIRSQNRVLPIIVIGTRDQQDFIAEHALLRAGVDQILCVDSAEGVLAIRHQLRCRINHRIGNRLFEELLPRAAVGASSLLISWCLRNGYRPISEFDLAKGFGISRRTVLRTLQRQGWPDVRSCIQAARLAHILMMLEQSDSSLDDIASSLTWSSGASLARFVKRLTGATPRSLREFGSAQLALRTISESWRHRI